MVPLLKAEIQKLLTVRSTFILCGVALLLAGFTTFWFGGYRNNPGNPFLITETISGVGTMLPLFFGIMGILLVTHEYRFNTIMYTLTASNSRSKVLLAKVAAVSLFSLAASVAIIVICVGLTLLGVNIAHDNVVAQHFFGDSLWKITFYTLAFVNLALLLAFLLRNVVGAIVTLLIAPTTIEPLLSLLLKGNSKYLPFAALEQVHTGSHLSSLQAALVFSTYLIVGWAVAWTLFLRRDAN